MTKFVAAIVAATMFCATAAVGQDDAGQQIYEANCSGCHQSDGSGMPPTFPALAGNDALANLEHILTTLQEGRGAMPAFPHLLGSDKASLASFIRNAWGNDFGAVTPEEVSAILGPEDEAASDAASGDGPISSWDGVYTEAQANRVKSLYESACAMCHGARMDGAALDPDRASAPPLARYTFLRNWDGRSLGTLFEYSRNTMPQQSPASLSDQEYVDIIAYMLSVSGMPAGDTELPPDTAALSNIRIDQEQP